MKPSYAPDDIDFCGTPTPETDHPIFCDTGVDPEPRPIAVGEPNGGWCGTPAPCDEPEDCDDDYEPIDDDWCGTPAPCDEPEFDEYKNCWERPDLDCDEMECDDVHLDDDVELV